MEYIKSCGFIAFKQENNENYYLIIKSTNGDVGFPKGHTEVGESEIVTATRELKEETNVEVEVIHNFREQIEYPLKRIPQTIKQSVYFLGRCISDEIVCQASEIKEARFLSYNDAISVLTFEETKRILSDAERFIRNSIF